MRALAFAALKQPDPTTKLALTQSAWNEAMAGKALVDAAPGFAVEAPGRPALPELLHPSKVPRRGLGSTAGRAALIHAVAHIEFNAINLALDAVCRFAGMPDNFYLDWLTVAKEEAYHFTLLADHLTRTYGQQYGDFPAHNGLWEMAEKTRDDVLVRMALVPRILEARGLDVTPGIRDKLAHHGDAAAAAILDIILRDEVGHVAVGNRWYTRLCAERGLVPLTTFQNLMREHNAPAIHPPLNHTARLAGGFTAAELSWLEGRAESGRAESGRTESGRAES